ncbi:MAG: prolipoprotein diacylglyceryl transferase [Myxococcales bacterium]|nr:prolipoprotein diacylglyceryl transferase [Myxococcales bacterium]
MHPILFELFGHEVRTYSMAMALGFVVSIILLRRRAPYEQIDVNMALNIVILCIVGTIVGGRLMFVINTWGERFATEGKSSWEVFLEAFKVWEGGLVFYGGFLGSILLVWLYVKIKGGDFAAIGDFLAPYVGLGLAIHRPFGCFMNGCCYGAPTDLPIGVHFPLDASATKTWGIDQALHPTQIYMGFNGLILFLLLRWYRERKRSHGEVFGLLLMVYAFNRFLIEIVRGDKIRGHVPLFDLLYFVLFAAGLALWLYARGRESRPRPVEYLGLALAGIAGFMGLFGTESGSLNETVIESPFSTSQFIGFFVAAAGAAMFYWSRKFGPKVQPEYGRLLPPGALSGEAPTEETAG